MKDMRLTQGPLQALLALLLAAPPVPLFAQNTPLASIAFHNEVEASLVRTMETLKSGGIQSALRELDATLEKNPNFHLGHFIRGDLLMAKSGAPVAFASNKAQPEMVASLRDEARQRLTRYFDAPPPDYLPSALLQLAPQQETAILVDSGKSRLYVFRNVDGRPEYVTDFYISAGKNGIEKEREGDAKTPLGVYRVTSTIPKEKLADLYGSGAFPLNYPNEVDRKLGKNGSGIWIHGTPSSTYSRPPRASDGCVVLTNDDFAKISSLITPGTTPVVIASSVEWKSPEQWQAGRTAFSQALMQWKHDWESLNTDAYLTHYSRHFNAEGRDFEDWSSNKRRINASKNFVKVEMSNLSIFEYPLAPGFLPFVMVTFDQDYKSSNNSTRMKKRQYWQLEDGQWKIVYESAAT
jgi:murein L,D-transpeptidase YafK